jgi:hypothetical protein
MPYVDMLFWNTGMFEGTLEGISERPVAECTAVQGADALTKSFEGHVMPVNVDPRGYERQFRPERVDPFASYVYFGEAGLVAVVLIAHREWTSRVAAHQTRAPLARLPTRELADEFPRR